MRPRLYATPAGRQRAYRERRRRLKEATDTGAPGTASCKLTDRILLGGALVVDIQQDRPVLQITRVMQRGIEVALLDADGRAAIKLIALGAGGHFYVVDRHDRIVASCL